MRLEKWLLLALVVGLFVGSLWAGYRSAEAPGPPLSDAPPADDPTPEPPFPAPSVLEPYLLLLRNSEDRQLLETLLETEGGIVYHAHLALARLLRIEADLDEAAVHYQKALSFYATSTVIQEYAMVLEESEQTQAACQQWQRVLPADAAVGAISGLCEPVAASRIFNRAGLFSQALAVLSGSDDPASHLEAGRARVGLGDRAAAVSALRTYLDHYPDDNQARVEYAAALDRTGQTNQALVEYQQAGAEGRRAAGRVLERLGRRSEAIDTYVLSPDPEARWRASQLLELTGQVDRANQIYAELAAGTSRLADDAALRLYLYYQRTNQPEASQAYGQKLSPGLVYLTGEFDEVWRLVDEPEPVQSLITLALADALLEQFTLEWSLIEIEIALREASPAERIALGQWLLNYGLYNRTVRLGMGLLQTVPARSVYELAYPRAYPELVSEAADEFGVDAHLIWAVMREESHFRADARSWADARGLMQVIPSTGEWIAGHLGEEYRGQNLYKPEVSIRYGAWYLAHLNAMFVGELAMVVAAYNGGPGSVNRWLDSPLYQEPVDLPGVAAFPETREYIGKVISSYLVYQWLYGD